MKVTARTDTRLAIRHRPVFWAVVFGAILLVLSGWALAGVIEGEWLGALIGASLALVLGWFMFTQLIRRFDLVLDRSTGRLRYADSTGTMIEAPLERLAAVACEASLDKDNGTPDYAVVLHLDAAAEPQEIRLAAFHLPPEDVLDVAGAIADWRAPGPTRAGARGASPLELSIPAPRILWLVLALCAALIVVGIGALLSGEVVRAVLLVVIGGAGGYVLAERLLARLDLRFDADAHRLFMRRITPLGHRHWSLPLEHFDGAELIERPRFRREGSANVDLVFRDTRPNMRLSLSPLGLPNAQAREIAAKINAWVSASLPGPA